MFAVLRVRGYVGVNRDIEHTLKLLNLTRANHCVLHNDNEKLRGLLKKGKDYITWGEISEETLMLLLVKRGNIYKDRKLVPIKDAFKETEISNLAKDILLGKSTVKKLNIKKVFRLKPPSKGYDRKGIKKTVKQGGVLGYRGDKINQLLKRMI